MAQVKRVRPAVGRKVPSFRDAGDGVEVVRVLFDEALENAVENAAVGFGDVGLWVEVLRLGTVAPVEHLIVITLRDAPPGPHATGARERGGKHQSGGPVGGAKWHLHFTLGDTGSVPWYGTQALG